MYNANKPTDADLPSTRQLLKSAGIAVAGAAGLVGTVVLTRQYGVLTGSLVRLQLGLWGDRYGGRLVLFVLMLSTIIPIYLIFHATEYWHFLLAGPFVGLAGGSFSDGIAYCARWFDRKNQGFAMGVFGAGNSGAALTKFVAPSIVIAWGWQAVPQIYAVAMLVTALAFWTFSYDDPAHRVGKAVSFADQWRALRDPRVWKYCQYYSIVFGGYVGLSLWMTKYYVAEYGFDLPATETGDLAIDI